MQDYGTRDSQFTTITSSTTETTIVTAGGTNDKRHLHGILITNTSSTDAVVTIRDSTGGSTKFTIYAKAQQTSGWVLPVESAIEQTTKANNWTAQSSASVDRLDIAAFFVEQTV